MAKKQGGLGLVGEGVEQKSIKEVDAAAEAYVDARDKRMAKTKIEKEQKDGLIAAMRKHGLGSYRLDTDPPQIVTLSTKDGVKVTALEAPEADGREDVN